MKDLLELEQVRKVEGDLRDGGGKISGKEVDSVLPAKDHASLGSNGMRHLPPAASVQQ